MLKRKICVMTPPSIAGVGKRKRKKAYLQTKLQTYLNVSVNGVVTKVEFAGLPGVIGCCLVFKKKRKDAYTEIEYDH